MADPINGTPGNDTIPGTSLGDVINGLGGNDTIDAGRGDDQVNGGEGDDVISDGPSGFSDTASDNDMLKGEGGNDHLIHRQGDHFQDIDILDGGTGDDLLEFFGTQTNNQAIGGDGNDHLSLWASTSTKAIIAQYLAGGFTIQVDGIDTLVATGIESVTFSTGTADDIISGGSNGDTLISTGGVDQMHAAGGDDVVQVNYSTNVPKGGVYDGGGGTDRLSYYVQYTTTQAFVFDLTTNTYTVDGVSLGTITGFEWIQVSTSNGADRLVGGALNDFFQAGGGTDQVLGNGGDDALRGMDGNDTIDGGGGNDEVGGDDGDDQLTGGSGSDTIHGGPGHDVLDGGTGDDHYLFYDVGDDTETIHDSGGTDTAETILATLSIKSYGMIENMLAYDAAKLTGNNIANGITGSDGDDTVSALDGNDTVDGGDGEDKLTGGDGKDSLIGGAGDDKLSGGDDKDALIGGAGDDELSGGAGDDTLTGDGAAVNPGIKMGSGVITVSGAGHNTRATAVDLTKSFSLASDPNIVAPTLLPHVTVHATGGNHVDYYALTVTKAGVTITLDVDRAGLANTLYTEIDAFDSKGNALASASYDDPSLGAGGSTSFADAYLSFVAPTAGTFYFEITDSGFYPIDAGVAYDLQVSVGVPPGDDVLDGGAGADKLDGGAGFDLASYASAKKGVEASLQTPANNTGDADGDKYVGIEGLAGSKKNDVLTGDGKANALEGLGGNDALDGGKGNDTVTGGEGKDSLSGGAGRDHFQFAVAATAANLDHVADFSAAADTIDLSSAFFAGLGSGVTEDEFVVRGKGHTADGALAQIIYDQKQGSLWYDDDGDGAHKAVDIAVLDGHPKHLTFENFAIV